jgi:hypothetical protein
VAATDVNLDAIADLSGAWIDRVHERRPPDGIILDMDSSEGPTHGDQEGSAFNGHFGSTCYHPLFVFNQFGDLERCRLRPGNVHSAEDWRLVLEPVIARYRERGVDLSFRADAAFAKPEVYELLEAVGIRFAIRLQANQVLQERIGYLLKRPVGRPPKKPIVSYVVFQLAEVAVPRALFAAIMRRIDCSDPNRSRHEHREQGAQRQRDGRGASTIDRGPLEGVPNSAHEAGNGFCRRCAPLSMPTLDAESLAFSVGESGARPSETGIWGISGKMILPSVDGPNPMFNLAVMRMAMLVVRNV